MAIGAKPESDVQELKIGSDCSKKPNALRVSLDHETLEVYRQYGLVLPLFRPVARDGHSAKDKIFPGIPTAESSVHNFFQSLSQNPKTSLRDNKEYGNETDFAFK